jgi:GT2 family glycosyltransferase
MEITIVIVLYNVKCNQSSSINTLKNALNAVSFNNQYNFNVLVYNNSPINDNKDECINDNYIYIHDPRNKGIAVAYNYGLKLANKLGSSWMLLLDQDSVLPEKYFSVLIDTLNKISLDEDLVAIIPKVIDKCNKVISPTKILVGRRTTTYTKNFNDYSQDIISAINSGTLLRVNFLNAIGGFNELFNLDFLDHWLFHTIQANKKRIYLINITIEHQLSVSNYDLYMSKSRYISILHAEATFIKIYGSNFDKFLYPFILTARIIKQLFLYKNKSFSIITAKHLFKHY